MNSHLLRFDKTKKILVFDCETFNLCLSFVHNRIWQFAYLSTLGEDIVKEKEINIKWDTDLKIGEGAARVTRFDQSVFDSKAINDSVAFEEVYEQFESHDYYIAHNGLGFDLYLLREWYKMNGKPWKHLANKLIDTNAIARGIKMDRPYRPGDNFLEYQYRCTEIRKRGIKTTQTALGKEFNIEHDYDSLHEALSDVKLNFKIWNVLKYQIEI